MPVKAILKPNTYHDSVKLMTVASAIAGLPGVETASVAMATPLNLDLLRDDGLMTADLASATPNDLVIAVRTETEEQAAAALAEAESLLVRRSTPTGGAEPRQPRSIGESVGSHPDLNLAIVSVPGRFAALEAEEGLRAGLHVLLFSDNVPLEDEIRLKRLAAQQGLLLMGPDCGTAIIGGVGLGFANAVRRGPIGVVGASGTGTQEVTCLIDALGSGISQAIGTGGRDLSREVGGMTMRQGITALGADPETRVIVLVSKPPDRAVAVQVLAEAAQTGKPVVAVFLGDTTTQPPKGVGLVQTLTEAAEQAVQAAGNGSSPIRVERYRDRHALERARTKLRPEQRYIRGLFAGGTLCDEALILLQGKGIGSISSNVPLGSQEDTKGSSRGHVLIDLGSDEFTAGRAHPMIDPTLRNDWIRREAADPAVGCLLLDVVLGYGAHPDPAGALAPVLADVREAARRAGRTLPVIISLCGAQRDPQGLERQERALRDAGAIVFRSNADAALAAATMVEVR